MIAATLLLALALYLGAQGQKPVSPPSDAPPTPNSQGIYTIGNGVSAPVVLYQPEVDYPKPASDNRLIPACSVALVVDSTGQPTSIRLLRSAAQGSPASAHEAALALDASCTQTVQRYRFKPALFRGQPVPVAMNLEINWSYF